MKTRLLVLWFILGLIPIEVQAAETAVLAIAPLAEPNTWQVIIDWCIANVVKPLVMAAVTTFVGVLFAPKVGLVWAWLAKYNITLDQARQQQFEDAVKASLSWATTQVLGKIEQLGPEGWKDPRIQAEIIDKAKPYMAEKFPAAVANTLKADVLPSIQMHPAMTRLLPQVLTEVAASPGTPAAPTTAVPVIEVAPKT